METMPLRNPSSVSFIDDLSLAMVPGRRSRQYLLIWVQSYIHAQSSGSRSSACYRSEGKNGRVSELWFDRCEKGKVSRLSAWLHGLDEEG